MTNATDYALVEIGDHVIYVDPTAREHNAVVTAVWGYTSKADQDEFYREFVANNPDTGADLDGLLATPWKPPSVNVVYVETDVTMTDTYGRQIKRNTSVPFQSVQPAHGMYWRIAS